MKDAYRTMSIAEIYDVTNALKQGKHDSTYKNNAEHFAMVFKWNDTETTRTDGSTRAFLNIRNSCLDEEIPLAKESDRLQALDYLTAEMEPSWPKTLQWQTQGITVTWPTRETERHDIRHGDRTCPQPRVCRQSLETSAGKLVGELGYVLAGFLPHRSNRERVKRSRTAALTPRA